MPVSLDIDALWAQVLIANNFVHYLSLFDTKNTVFWHFSVKLGLWWRWDVGLQNWVPGTPAGSAQLIACPEKPI